MHLRLRLERVALRHVCPAVLPRLSRRGARDCCVHRQAAALVSPRRTLPHTCRRAAAQPSYIVTSAFLSGSLSPPPLPPPPLVTVSGGLSAHPGAPVSPSALPPAPSRRTFGTSASRARRTGRPSTSRRLAAVTSWSVGSPVNEWTRCYSGASPRTRSSALFTTERPPAPYLGASEQGRARGARRRPRRPPPAPQRRSLDGNQICVPASHERTRTLSCTQPYALGCVRISRLRIYGAIPHQRPDFGDHTVGGRARLHRWMIAAGCGTQPFRCWRRWGGVEGLYLQQVRGDL